MAAGGARLLEGGPIADEIRTAVAEDVASFTLLQRIVPDDVLARAFEPSYDLIRFRTSTIAISRPPGPAPAT